MIPTDKKTLYRELKEAGAELPKPYRNLTATELQEEYRRFFGDSPPSKVPTRTLGAVPQDSTIPGFRANTSGGKLEVLRVDEQGRKWLQEEIRKPTGARRRGRRVLSYRDPGVSTKTLTQDGRFEEAFEIAGDQDASLQYKITLPSYQVGIYIDPRYPWRVMQYQAARGFHYDDIVAYYGGRDLIPATVKRVYVDRMLCFDIPSVVQAVQEEARRLRLS